MIQANLKGLLLAVFVSWCSLSAWGQEAAEETTINLSEVEMAQLLAYQQYADSVEQAMDYLPAGETITLGDDLAQLSVPEGFKYLSAAQSSSVLIEVWGNPGDGGTLGMLFPAAARVLDDSSYAINITYEEMGFVDDDDADDIDYDELLESMQDDLAEENDQRIEMGYDPIQLIGWASKPYYDASTKKLHWAKELKFGEAELHTLNYNVRMLGRKGVLEMNFVASMDLLDQVKADIPAIMPAVDFQQGMRYMDFDPDIDEVAAVGIGGLIAGKVLAKAGIFALLAKFGKVIIAAVIGFFALLRKRIFGGKKGDDSEA